MHSGCGWLVDAHSQRGSLSLIYSSSTSFASIFTSHKYSNRLHCTRFNELFSIFVFKFLSFQSLSIKFSSISETKLTYVAQYQKTGYFEYFIYILLYFTTLSEVLREYFGSILRYFIFFVLLSASKTETAVPDTWPFLEIGRVI